MYILQNVAKSELNAYATSPTAKTLNERIKKDAVYIEKVLKRREEAKKTTKRTKKFQRKTMPREIMKTLRKITA